MRLLNVNTFTFKEFHQNDEPPYIAASHRWTNDETCHKDIRKGRSTDTAGYKKVQAFCEAVKRTTVATRAAEVLGAKRNCEWLWIDTACIDKAASAEISESINSMMQWYADSEACYAFLPDVGSLVDYENAIHDFFKSEWFRRGWTLQELIAPKVLVFFTRDWEVLGHKCPREKCDETCDGFGVSLNTKIEKITKIPADILKCYHKHSARYGVEDKKRWAADRITTRPEDGAYCLLGLLNARLVPIYGEGLEAWDRLEEIILKKAAAARAIDLGHGVAAMRPRYLTEEFSARGLTRPSRMDITAANEWPVMLARPNMLGFRSIDDASFYHQLGPRHY